MRFSTVLLVLLSSTFTIYSQSSKNDFSIVLGTGIDIISFKDISSSPLAYSGFGLPIVLGANYKTENTLHQFNIGIITESVKNNYPMKSRANTQLLIWGKTSFRYSFSHKIKDDRNYLGVSLNALFFYREYDFLDGQSYEFLGSINADYLRVFPVSAKYKIISRISLPTIAYINRKPSLTLDEAFLDDFHNNRSLIRYGEVKSIFQNWFVCEFSINNEFQISENIDISTKLGIEYYTINFPQYTRNILFSTIETNYLDNIERHTSNIISGSINSTIGYVYVSDFKGENLSTEHLFNTIIDGFSDKKGLIIDLRENDGGSVYNAQSLLNKLTDRKTLWHTTQNKTKDGFDQKYEWYVEPSGDFQFTNDIVVLTGRYTISAGERFAIGAKLLSNIKIIGDTTANTQGSVMGRELTNGWKYTFTFEKCLDPDGKSYEGIGIDPDIFFQSKNLDFSNHDIILERAINELL